ncbi:MULTISPECIES: FeoB-associated Cys-rich membrane protein [unclassified Mucilaginibacter]|uniref:FeoB-associated Cys-rich membrane protein n=1 Tax=unclassified Mucilaginibacter TaxID=2617802 RepID=UPI002AC9B799|nr:MULTISPECIES: FeoB-associated Cys-rich membrane protein [unclassified Mucilaginibacter]MEB0278595.1 FeoB-associated Cys-rich membrane protein [Mucilaginibacter sp. 10B2]MEB0299305.1 FeoB-associated Cys-rich membrane protein [Mucilaginibacter sp. 5C4]WPX23450.1 FeoB-associated Cys-rich membrane protein [Mucilaginibacter sp. 5C4]
MNIQAIIIIVLFIAAVFYVCRLLYKSLFSKKTCGSNCKCGVDFSGVDAVKQTK